MSSAARFWCQLWHRQQLCIHPCFPACDPPFPLLLPFLFPFLLPLSFLLFFFLMEIGSHYAAQAGLGLTQISVPLPPADAGVQSRQVDILCRQVSLRTGPGVQLPWSALELEIFMTQSPVLGLQVCVTAPTSAHTSVFISSVSHLPEPVNSPLSESSFY